LLFTKVFIFETNDADSHSKTRVTHILLNPCQWIIQEILF
jgi:hypothetical protein